METTKVEPGTTVDVALKMICKSIESMKREISFLREDVDKILENIGAIKK